MNAEATTLMQKPQHNNTIATMEVKRVQLLTFSSQTVIPTDLSMEWT